MVTIQIGESILELNDGRDLDENSVIEQINRRRRGGQTVCVRVSIKEGSINMSLESAGCAGSGVVGRAPNQQERKIFDLWEKVGMKKSDFHGGNLIAFLKQLHRLLD